MVTAHDFNKIIKSSIFTLFLRHAELRFFELVTRFDCEFCLWFVKQKNGHSQCFI